MKTGCARKQEVGGILHQLFMDLRGAGIRFGYKEKSRLELKLQMTLLQAAATGR